MKVKLQAQGKRLKYHVKGLVTRNIVFQMKVKLQAQGKRLKYHVKGLVTRNTVTVEIFAWG